MIAVAESETTQSDRLEEIGGVQQQEPLGNGNYKDSLTSPLMCKCMILILIILRYVHAQCPHSVFYCVVKSPCLKQWL